MGQTELFSKNAFSKTSQSRDIFPENNEITLAKIEALILKERYEDARTLLNILITDDYDPLKVKLNEEMDDAINQCDPDGQEEIRREYSDEYDGTDVRPYLSLDKKLKCGTAKKTEITDLYLFWSAYPDEKSIDYKLNMLNWLWQAKLGFSRDLIFSIEKDMETDGGKYFMLLIGKERSDLDADLIEGIASNFTSLSKKMGKSEFLKFKKTNRWPAIFLQQSLGLSDSSDLITKAKI